MDVGNLDPKTTAWQERRSMLSSGNVRKIFVLVLVDDDTFYCLAIPTRKFALTLSIN